MNPEDYYKLRRDLQSYYLPKLIDAVKEGDLSEPQLTVAQIISRLDCLYFEPYRNIVKKPKGE